MEKIEVVDLTQPVTPDELYRLIRGICSLCDQDYAIDGHDPLCPCAENKERGDA